MTYTYIQHVPSAPLDLYVDDLYYWNGPAPFPQMKVPPMPSSHLMVSLGDPFHVHRPDQAEPFVTCTTSWAVGLWNTYHVVAWPRRVEFYGIHFKLGGAYPFMRLPQSQLHNQVVALDGIWGNFAAELRERLHDATNAQYGLHLFERLLLTRLRETPQDLNVVQYALLHISQQHGSLSIRDLSDHIGISQNHLLVQFKRMVGIPPKELARLCRFGQICSSINPAQTVDWTQIAHDFGYYDQSHFNKEFAAFIGQSPTDYLRLHRKLHALDPERNQLHGLLPID